MGMNRVTLQGNLTADASLRYTKAGTPVSNFRLACAEKYRDRDGKWVERVEFIGCVLWGNRAKGLVGAEMLLKGQPLLVTGKMRTRKYDRKGEDAYVTEVEVQELHPLNRGGQQHQQSDPPEEPPTPGDDFAPADSSSEDIPF